MLLGLSRDITAEKEWSRARAARAGGNRRWRRRAIQQSILPGGRLGVAGFRVAGCASRPGTRPATSSTGGSPAGGRGTVCVGDVTGHGIGPAILAAACKAYGRSLIGDAVPLHLGVAGLNRATGGEVSDGRFVTLAAVRLDPLGGTASVVSAGHGPVLLYTAASGAVSELPTHGLPLGIDADGSTTRPPTCRSPRATRWSSCPTG
jgi:serine phosphatase RsbU (regulator of sigma subunit)